MSQRSNVIFRSYAKTTAACFTLVAVSVLFAVLAAHWLPSVLSAVVAVASGLVALGSAFPAIAGVVVLVRHRRGALRERDLFLELNRSREPSAIEAAAPARISLVRRWLARRVLGHGLVVGDLVEVKTWAEIRSTLDESGRLRQLPFMPEMLAMCGRRARVFRCVHRLFDYRKTRRMRHMGGTVLLVGTVCDGSSHGGCEAACHTLWNAAWLRRVEARDDAVRPPPPSDLLKDTAVVHFGTHAPHYSCQLTQLNAASRPIGDWSAINFLRPVIAGNVAPMAFVVGWLTHLFNELQHLRQGVGFPAFDVTVLGGEGQEDPRLQAGDEVVVRSSAEIRATLNDQSLHKGLYFEPDMLKHCGRRYRVQAEVKKIIDIVTGEMRTMKTPAYTLGDVHFSGERQLFNAQHEPLFWRSAWLKREGG